MNSTLPFPRSSGTAVYYAAIGVGAILLTAGCGRRPIVVQAPPATVIQQPAPATAVAVPTPAPSPAPVIVVNQPPPAPLQETAAPQPSPQHVWIPGYWAWRNNQQQWIPGRWEIPPRAGATWVSPRWEQRGSEYVFIDGYWQ